MFPLIRHAPAFPLARLPALTLILFGLLRVASAQAPAPHAPDLPGVRLVETRDPRSVPQGVEVAGIEVDWTHPLLHIELQAAPETPPALPPAWSRGQLGGPDALRIQLIEPQQLAERWIMALPWQPATAPGEQPTDWSGGGLSEFSWLRLADPALPWIPGGLAFAGLPEWQSPLGADAAHAAVRWMGRRNELAAMPEFEFRGLCLFSFTTPETARTRFFLAAYRQPGPFSVARLASWLGAEALPSDWIALHSMDRDAIVGDRDWRLQPSAADRTIERLGLALVLRRREIGEIVDWTRFDGAKVAASSFERDFPPSNVSDGRLLPRPFDPPVWISRAETRHGEKNWIRVEFNSPRPVTEIRLILPAAVGMSPLMNPARIAMLGSDRGETDLSPLAEWTPGDAAQLIWQPDRPATLRVVRLELEGVQGLPIDHRGRLAGLQVFGPWDGSSDPLPGF